jgi:putative hemolysin
MRGRPRFEVHVTRETRWVRQAQRLRYLVFADELGANLPGPGRDEDAFDAHCEHLVVHDREADEVAGTYRILSPDGARCAGGYYAEQRFDMTLLHLLRGRMVEVGRACVHGEYRAGNVMLLMWTALARYLIENRHDYVMGSASIGVSDGGHAAASVYRAASARAMSPEDLRMFPVRRLALDRLHDTLPVAPPPLLRAYLNLGAWVGGEPALDPDFGCVDIPILLPLARMHTRYTRHFLAQAA